VALHRLKSIIVTQYRLTCIQRVWLHCE